MKRDPETASYNAGQYTEAKTRQCGPGQLNPRLRELFNCAEEQEDPIQRQRPWHTCQSAVKYLGMIPIAFPTPPLSLHSQLRKTRLLTRKLSLTRRLRMISVMSILDQSLEQAFDKSSIAKDRERNLLERLLVIFEALCPGVLCINERFPSVLLHQSHLPQPLKYSVLTLLRRLVEIITVECSEYVTNRP